MPLPLARVFMFICMYAPRSRVCMYVYTCLCVYGGLCPCPYITCMRTHASVEVCALATYLLSVPFSVRDSILPDDAPALARVCCAPNPTRAFVHARLFMIMRRIGHPRTRLTHRGKHI